MIDYNRIDSIMILGCDTCGIKAEFKGDIKEWIAEAKENDWIFIKKKGGLHQYCSTECRGVKNN